MTVIVDTIKGTTFRTMAHIDEEVFKISPPFAYHDTSTSIEFVVFPVRMKATPDHVSPDLIFGCFISSMSGCSSTTTATYGTSRLKIITSDFFDGSARALANPKIAIAMTQVTEDASAVTQNEQTAELLACDIFESGHGDRFRRLLRQVAVGSLHRLDRRVIHSITRRADGRTLIPREGARAR